MFAALENASDDEDINRGWENIKDNIKTSATESLGIRGLLEKYPTFGREKETGLLGALDT